MLHLTSASGSGMDKTFDKQALSSQVKEIFHDNKRSGSIPGESPSLVVALRRNQGVIAPVPVRFA